MVAVTFLPRSSGGVGEASSPPAVVIGTVWEGPNPTASTRTLGGEALLARLEEGFQGKAGQTVTTVAPPGSGAAWLVLVGLGPFGEADPALIRRAGAEAGVAAALVGAETLALDWDLSPDLAAEFAFGLRLRLYRPPHQRHRPTEEDKRPRPQRLLCRLPDPRAAHAAWDQASALAEGVETARRLCWSPGNHLTPTALCAEAEALAPLGLAVETIMGEAAVQRHGLRLLAAVGQASAQPPALVVLRWRGAADATTAPRLLVGKGITFDTGGLCLKPAEGMEEMKGDMGGAASVLGAMKALALRQAPVNVTALLAVAENMPGGRALRPGDVLTAHNGKTVEIIDTDAEGRLVLADALSWGCAVENPSAVVDLATLTGAVVTSLGRHHAGLFCRDAALSSALRAAAEQEDEALWPLPLTPFLDDDLTSPCADLRQCAPMSQGEGGWSARMIPDARHAARFLSHFVPEGVPYAHLDIAGVAEAAEASGPVPAGPRGFGVRTLVRWLERGA